MAFAAASAAGAERTRTLSLSGCSGCPSSTQLGQPQLHDLPDMFSLGAEQSIRKSRQSVGIANDPFAHHHHDHHNKAHHHHDHNVHFDSHKSFEDLSRKGHHGQSEPDGPLGKHGLRKLLADQLAVVQQALLASQRSILESLESVLEQGEKDAQQIRVLLIQAGAPAAAMVNDQARKTMLQPETKREKKVSIMPGPPEEARKASMMPGMPLPGVLQSTPPVHKPPSNAPMPPSCFKNGNMLSVHPSGGTPAGGSARGNLQMDNILPAGHCEEGKEKATSNADETCVETLALNPEPPLDQPVTLPCPNFPVRSATDSQTMSMLDSCRSSLESWGTGGIGSEESQEYHNVYQMGCQQTHGPPTVIKFYVSHAWTKDNENEAAKIGNVREVRNKSLIKAYTKTDFQEDMSSKTTKYRRKFVEGHFHNFVIYPYSVKRALWDLSSLIIVLYDLIVIPFQLFDPGESPFTDVMTWVVRIFWTVDIPLSFLTGYMMSDGVIEMRVRRIARHYLHTWFGLDFLLVLSDWVETFGTGGTWGYARMGKASRTFRILRMVRLLRLFRMREVLRQVSERVHSERLTIVLDIAKMMVVILGLAHVLACLWYGIGVSGSSQETWVRVEPGFEADRLENRYIKSLHWSLSQFSGGMDEINPHNFIERMFASGAFILAFIMAAVFVSGLTSSMTRLDILASYQSKQLAVLRRYLLQNRISDKLTLRVQRNAIHAMSEQQRLMQESSVDLLQVVSEPLRVELHFEMYAGVLEVHPLFHRYIDHCPQVMRRVCHLASSTLLVSKGDLIFNAGEIPTQPKMYIVCTGSFEYVPIAGDVSKVEGASWLAEACLWVPWMHRGVLKAVQDGRLCLLDSNRFAHVATQFVTTDFNPRYYAEKFVQHLNRCEDPLLFTDLALGIEHLIVEDSQNRPAEDKSWLRRLPSIFMSEQASKIKRRQSAFFEKVMPK